MRGNSWNEDRELTERKDHLNVMEMIFCVMICMGLIVSAGSSNAATYYVSLSGNDGWTGISPETAWRHIANGVKQLKAGDELKVKAGNYGNEKIIFPVDGLPGNPIVLRGYDGTPVLEDPANKNYAAFIIGGKKYITVENFKIINNIYGVHISDSSYINVVQVEVDSPAYIGIMMTNNVHNTLIDSCVVHNTGWNGIMVFGRQDVGDPCSNITIQNCEVYDQKIHNGIDIHCEVSDSKVLNNHVHDFNNMGIFVHSWHVSNIEVRGNVCHSVERGVWLWNSKNCEAKNNIIYDCRQYGILVLSAEEGNGLEQAENNTIENNLIYNCTSTSWGGYGIVDMGGRGTLIKNNTIYGSTKAGIKMWDATDFKTTQASIQNNIVVSNNYYGIMGDESQIDIIGYNNVWNNNMGDYGGGISPGDNDISKDPLFADLNNNDYHLKSQFGRWENANWVYDTGHSPGIDAGDPSSDYQLEPGKNGYRINMGAYGNTEQASQSKEGDYMPPAAIPAIQENKTKIYPNPYVRGENPDEYIFFTNLPEAAIIRIYTVTGKLVKSIRHSEGIRSDSERWDVSDIAGGVYIYQINTSGANQKGKICIIK